MWWQVLLKKKNEFTHIKNDFSNPGSIAGDEIWDIAQDKKGNLWFGTYNSGLSICSSNQPPFETYQNDPKNSNSTQSTFLITIDGFILPKISTSDAPMRAISGMERLRNLLKKNRMITPANMGTENFIEEK
ncbi:MAG: hypothetical protein HGB14_08910 [Anaerolineaceae bacterium]|nr:hypothetical protein [Anaerolineaceae bacterium]